MTITKRLMVLNVVGLSPHHLGENTPNLLKMAKGGTSSYIQPQLPAVTSSVQATYTTGSRPGQHGIVANGWYMEDLAEVRFWHQSNHLLHGEQIWTDLKKIDPKATSANIFWWYNMYCPADIAVTVRPMYPSDGRKIPDIYTFPSDLRQTLNSKLGQFPLFNFWGPFSNIKSSEWIAQAGEHVITQHQPNLTMIYLPHLDYALQKDGPDSPTIPTELQKIDSVCGKLFRVADEMGIEVVVLSEYGISAVDRPIHINRIFREKGWLTVRDELGRELLDPGASKVFAVADHQVAHIYIQDGSLVNEVQDTLNATPGIDLILDNKGKEKYGLDHKRSGDLIAISGRSSWFTYYYWLDASKAPDYAKTIEIHKKPGYDPVELFIDPGIKMPKVALAWRLLKKKMGFRTLMDVIPIDADLVKGSHGAIPESPDHGAIFISSETITLNEQQRAEGLAATDIKATLLNLLK